MNPELKRLKGMRRELIIEREELELEHWRIRGVLEEYEDLLEESYLAREDVLNRLNNVETKIRKTQE